MIVKQIDLMLVQWEKMVKEDSYAVFFYHFRPPLTLFSRFVGSRLDYVCFFFSKAKKKKSQKEDSVAVFFLRSKKKEPKMGKKRW